MSRAWYQLALAPVSAGGTGTLVAASGHHLGEAIAEAERAFRRRVVVAAQRAATAPLGESIGRRSIVELGPATFAAEPVRWPAGVLPELSGLPALATAGAGFVVHREATGLAIEAQVSAEKVVDVFLGLVEKLPAADNIEVRLMHHFDSAAVTDVWLSPRIGARRVLRFLDAHERELIGNGFVELSVYVRQEHSTLRLTEHKTVLWLSRDPSTEARTTAALRSLGVAPAPALVSIDSVPHLHVRPERSRDRDTLARYLEKLRLRRVDRLDSSGASIAAGDRSAGASSTDSPAKDGAGPSHGAK